MSKFVILFVCFATIQIGLALRCKTCQDPKDPSCTSLEDQTCGAAPSNMELACLVHIYKEGKDSKDEMVEKKCVNQQKGSKYECIPVQNRVEIKCITCTTDLCNEKNSASPASHLGALSVGLLVTMLGMRLLL